MGLDLPWGLRTYSAIQAALYQLENLYLTENERKRRAMEILREVEAPTPEDCGVSLLVEPVKGND